MTTHIFISENLYTFKYLKFLEGNFDISSSVFVFKKAFSIEFNYGEALSGRIIKTRNNISFFYSLMPLLRRSSRILFHQLPHGPSLILWSLFPGLLKKVTWIIWGGDVYLYQQAGKSISGRFYEYFRRKIIRRIPRIASFAPGDYETVREVYGTVAEYLHSMYPLPVDFLNYQGKARDGVFTILAGNSGSPSNRHLEILEKLAPLKDYDIRIFCPLSYLGDAEYIRSVERSGEMLFGEKFIPLHQILETSEYLDLLYNTDAGIMNHDRQQGLGNILPLLYFGKKVYARSGTSSYRYLESLGCCLYDIAALDKFDESLFNPESEKLERNKQIVAGLLSGERYIKTWEKILN